MENFDYDTGVEELDGLTTVHLPNGIPDAAELMSLQAVMQNPGWVLYAWHSSATKKPFELDPLYIFRDTAVAATAEWSG